MAAAEVPDSDKKQELSSKWPGELLFAVIATGVWVVLVALLFYASKQCAESGNWMARAVECRQPNEIGDFLAGASAPVAFLWLVVAVLVQARELSAQREELKLTRKEFEQNRSVLKEQVSQLEHQNKLLESERDMNREAAIERQFVDEALSLYRCGQIVGSELRLSGPSTPFTFLRFESNDPDVALALVMQGLESLAAVLREDNNCTVELGRGIALEIRQRLSRLLFLLQRAGANLREIYNEETLERAVLDADLLVKRCFRAKQ